MSSILDSTRRHLEVGNLPAALSELAVLGAPDFFGALEPDERRSVRLLQGRYCHLQGDLEGAVRALTLDGEAGARGLPEGLVELAWTLRDRGSEGDLQRALQVAWGAGPAGAEAQAAIATEIGRLDAIAVIEADFGELEKPTGLVFQLHQLRQLAARGLRPREFLGATTLADALEQLLDRRPAERLTGWPAHPYPRARALGLFAELAHLLGVPPAEATPNRIREETTWAMQWILEFSGTVRAARRVDEATQSLLLTSTNE